MGLPGMHRTRHRASLLHESPRRPAHKRIQRRKGLLTEESTIGAQQMVQDKAQQAKEHLPGQ